MFSWFFFFLVIAPTLPFIEHNNYDNVFLRCCYNYDYLGSSCRRRGLIILDAHQIELDSTQSCCYYTKECDEMKL